MNDTVKDLQRERDRLEELFSAALDTLYQIQDSPTTSRSVLELIEMAKQEFARINAQYRSES
jgi:hypothetical protein